MRFGWVWGWGRGIVVKRDGVGGGDGFWVGLGGGEGVDSDSEFVLVCKIKSTISLMRGRVDTAEEVAGASSFERIISMSKDP